MANRKPTIVIDIDGVLCSEGGAYQTRTPNRRMIDRVLEVSERYYIVLWTARPVSAQKVTVAWLSWNGVVYDKLLLGKPRAMYYVDDRGMSPERFLDGTAK